MLHGERVIVDGDDVYNVIVQVGETYTSGSKSQSIDDWQGPIADYVLHFPMDYAGDLTGKHVEVRGIACEVLGHPDHQRPEQVFGTKWRGKWDMPVRVRRTIAGMNETITLIAKTVTRDAVGRRTESQETLYEGAGQARMSSGTESDKRDGTEARESFVFVIDWIDGLDAIPTQTLFVEYKGKTFNVTSVEDKDEKGETAVLVGVCHD